MYIVFSFTISTIIRSFGGATELLGHVLTFSLFPFPFVMVDEQAKQKNTQLFDDDFAEASVEAISLAALRSKTQTRSDLNIDNTFIEPAVDIVPTNASTSALRRLLSSLLQCHQEVSPGSSPATHSIPFNPSIHAHPSLTLPSAFVHLVHPNRHQLWYLHVVSLPHNAIRAELIDLCAMLQAISMDTNPPFHLLQQWYPPFRSFVLSYLAFEHTDLLPWVYAGVDDQQLLDIRNDMVPDRALISHLLDELANALTLVSTRPLPYILPLLIRAVRDLVTPVLSYLDREEHILPNLIHAHRSKFEAVNVERLMANRLDIGLLLRWVPHRSRRMSLRFKYLSISDFIAYFFRGRIHTIRHLSIVRSIVGPPHPT